MAKIVIDGKEYEVKDGQNLLKAALSVGLNVPYFCWHPALGSVGACRLCAVQQFADEKDTKGRMVMSCMTPAANGTHCSVEHPEAKAFRASVLEWLMANHPHDCPVCDEGGECHLQDMTVMTGHNTREYRFNKRTYKNQNLGPFINHEMNRCIQCYRCVRYYRDYAGGRDLDVFGAHDNVYFGRHEDGTLENVFSGNLVEVCPTGVFTDKTLKKQYVRKWDLSTAPSVCTHCSLGCNTIPGERYGKVVRILNRYNAQVNGYFICDRGRFGYEFVNGERRVRRASVRAVGQAMPEPVGRESALGVAASALKGRVVGVGSPRASLESNFALRALVGTDNFYAGVSAREASLVDVLIDALRKGPARSASLHDVEQCDAVLVLGEDPLNYAPRLALALRQAARNKPLEKSRKLGIPDWNDAAAREVHQDEKGPVFIAAPFDTPLDEIATETFRAAPEEIARFGFAVARALNASSPAVEGLPEATRALAGRVAKVLKEAKRPLVVSGTGAGSAAVIQAAANVAWALSQPGRPADLFLTAPEANSVGLGLMGAKPLDEAFRAVREGKADAVVVLENDLYRRADAGAVNAFLDGAKHVVAVEHTANATTAKAGVVLPAATFAEGDGTFVSSEGRAQRSFQVFSPQDEVQESWCWMKDLSAAAGRAEAAGWNNLDDVLVALAGAMPIFKTAADAAPHADFRVAGLKVARQSGRATGRTAITADVNVSEPKPPTDDDSPLSFTMEGYSGPNVPGALVNRFWAPGWNSVQSLNKFQSEVGGPLSGGDPGVRLFEPAGAAASYYKDVPDAVAPKPGEWLLVALPHIFGSDELSALAPAVAERSPKPAVALNPEDAKALGLAEGAMAKVVLGPTTHHLPVHLRAMPKGVAGLPAGYPSLPAAAFPAPGRIEKGGK